MAFNSSGVYLPPVAPTFPAVAQTKILASQYNAQIQDIADALSACVTRAGLAAATANLPMGGFRHTGVGVGVSPTDYTSMRQTQDGTVNWVVSSGSADTITAAYTPSIPALIDGQVCFVRAALANKTVAPTFSPNGLTARTIVQRGGKALVPGNIAGSGHELALRYDLTNTRWELLNPAAALVGGVRNRIINGACNIAQRASLAVGIGVTGYGGPDRFQALNSGAGGQFTQSASTLTFEGLTKKTVRQTVDTGTTAFTTTNRWQGLHQSIEGLNVHDLRGKPVVLSFIFNTNLSGTYSVSVRDGGNSQSYISIVTAVANIPQRVTLTLPAIPLAASVPNSNAVGLTVSVGFQNQGSFETGTINAWQAGNFGTATVVAMWSATLGNFIELTELQLEEGTVGTAFEPRSHSAELALCQRYARVLGRLSGVLTTTTDVRAPIVHLGMRAAPTISFITALTAVGTATSSITSPGITGGTAESSLLTGTVAASTAGQAVHINDSTDTLLLTAEL